MTLWLYKRVIIHKITSAAVALWDIMDIALARSELERLQRAACPMITGAMRTTPIIVPEIFLDLPTPGTVVESTALMVVCRLPRPDPRNPGIGHNWIWANTDKVDSKFSMIKDPVTLRRTFSKYRIAIPTREEWGKTGPINRGKGMSGLQMEPVEFANAKAKYSGTFHWDRKLQPFGQWLRQYWTV